MDRWGAVRRAARDVRERAALEAGEGDVRRLTEAMLRLEGLDLIEFHPKYDFYGEDKHAFLVGRNVAVSSILSQAERAVAIAHEIGHSVLHDQGQEDRAPRRGPNGERLHGGYATRQRKEAQATLFGDEALIPSSRVRDGLAAGRSLSSMVEDECLPRDVLLRQATHALLPPGPGAGVRVEPPNLDGAQRECVTWSEGALLVTGPAGTGKTTVLAARLLHLVDLIEAQPIEVRGRRGADTCSSLLAVVATPRAADALEAHVAAHRPGAVGRVTVCTLAELAHEIVVRWPDRIGRDQRVRLADRTEALGVLAALPTPPPARLLHDLAARRTDAGAGVEREADFAEALERGNSVYSGDVIASAVRVLERDPELVADLREAHRHVLVDDLQDVPAAGIALLQLICAGARGLWATGDSAQTIDRYRGVAGEEAFADFVRRFGGSQRRLDHRYRARGGVLALVERIDAPAGRRRRTTAAAARLTIAPDLPSEAKSIRDGIEELRRSGVPLRDQVLLTRSHSRLGALAGALTSLGVPMLHLGDARQRDDVRALKAVLSLAHGGTTADLVHLAAAPPYLVPPDDSRRLQAQASRAGRTTRSLLADPSAVTGLSEPGATGLARLGADLDGLGGGDAHQLLSAWIFDRPGAVATALAPSASLQDRLGLVAIYQTLVICEEHRASGSGDLAALFDRIDNQNALDRLRLHRHVTLATADLDAVRAMTMPASRGMQFRAVHIAGMSKLRRPVSESDAEDEIFRVAVSRASEHVRFYRARRYDGRRDEPSPHLSKLDGLLEVRPRA